MHLVNAKSILSPHNGMNIYRGCTHGCIYCDSRSDCYRITHAFEDIEVKQNAAELLAKALSGKRKKGMIATGSMCDPYMPLEMETKLMRRCLCVMLQYGFGATVLTKSCRLERDIDLFSELNRRTRCIVQMTLTTFAEPLCRILEPNVSTTRERYASLKRLQAEGIPTVVWLSPVLPFINDTEENLRGVLDYCFDAGVKGIICYGIGTTMRAGSRDYFYHALERHFPGMQQRYMKRYGDAYECTSDNNARLMRIFDDACEQRGVLHRVGQVFDYLFEFPDAGQTAPLSLF